MRGGKPCAAEWGIETMPETPCIVRDNFFYHQWQLLPDVWIQEGRPLRSSEE